jgi:peptide chain release factor 1
MKNEAGGHRWQRVPPTEKRGRVHTSTITVVVLDEKGPGAVQLRDKDIRITTCRGSGKGGQHRNTTDSAVQVTHIPTGIQVRAENERSQHLNKAVAKDLLRLRLSRQVQSEHRAKKNAQRRKQAGQGARADKRRTIALQRGQVTDHITGRRMAAKAYLRGDLSRLWS